MESGHRQTWKEEGVKTRGCVNVAVFKPRREGWNRVFAHSPQ